MRGITLGEWARTYGLEGFEVTAEEIAWATIDRFKWPATPELLCNLIIVVEERELKKRGLTRQST